MKSFLKKNYLYLIVYSIIFLFLFLQHNVIGMYYDDYGNASLSYSYTVKNVIGTEFTFSQLIEHSIYTYFHFGGRILYGLIASLLLKNGIKLFMILQVFVLLGIFYFISNIISHITKKNRFWYPILCMVLYMLFDISIVRHGIYWASASILYVWPLLFLFAVISYYLNTIDKVNKKKNNISYFKYISVIFFLIFFGVFSQEQLGVSLIVFFVMYILFDHIKREKKYLKYDLFPVISSIIIYLLLFLAPGNYERLNNYSYFTNQSIFSKIYNNIPNILDLLFKKKASIFISILVLLLMIYLGYTIIHHYKKNKKYLFLILPFLGMSLDFLFYYNSYGYGAHFIIITCVILLSIFTTLFFYYYQIKQLKYLSIPISAFVSIACLVMSPYMLERCVIPCIFMMFIPIVSIGIDLFSKDKIIKVLLILLCIICGCYGLYNSIKIYVGYAKNYPIVMDNYHKLEKYKNNSKKHSIRLCRLKDDLYSSSQPYNADYDFWIKQYFNLPNDFIMEWEYCTK